MLYVYLWFFLARILLDFFISQSGPLFNHFTGHSIKYDIEYRAPELTDLFFLEKPCCYLIIYSLDIADKTLLLEGLSFDKHQDRLFNSNQAMISVLADALGLDTVNH